MFDIGFMELLVIGVVALIVVGPKDLPGMFQSLGRMTAKARGMAREFQRAMSDAADQSGVKETAAGLKTMTSKKNLGLDALDRAADNFEKWQPTKGLTSARDKDAKPATGAHTDALRKSQAERANKLQQDTAKRLSEARDREDASAVFAGPAKATTVKPAGKAAEYKPVRPPAGRQKNMPKKGDKRPAKRGR